MLLAVLMPPIVASCSEGECDKGYRPDDCVTTTPGEGIVRIDLTINVLNPRVPLTLYRGTIQQNDVVLTDTVEVPVAQYRVPNGYYSVAARYRSLMGRDTVTIVSVDGSTLRAESTDYCDGSCWREGSMTLDAMLE